MTVQTETVDLLGKTFSFVPQTKLNAKMQKEAEETKQLEST